jgi:hypothetical protein
LTANRIRVPVPAETGGEDRLVGSLTFRHAAYLAAAAAGVAVMLLGHASIARLALGAVLAVVGVVGAMLRPYGEPLDRLAFAAIGYVVRSRGRRVDDQPVATTGDHATLVEAETAPVVPPDPVETAVRGSRVDPAVVRRLLVAVAVCGVAAIAVTRLMDQPVAPAPAPRVVVVPVPVPPPDPWGEVDRDLDFWLNFGG